MPQSSSLLFNALVYSVTAWLRWGFKIQVPSLETPTEFSAIIYEPQAPYLALFSLPLFKRSCGSFHFLLFDARWVPVSHCGLSVSEHEETEMVALLEGSISTSSNSQEGSVTKETFLPVEMFLSRQNS